ncbi:MAG: peptide chain release factor 1 [Firmicutes bacterium]|nr:peptide chain release factor 1 [Bacillota bacterium]
MNHEKLKSIIERYNFLGEKIMDPTILSNQKEWAGFVKEQKSFQTTVETIEKYFSCEKDVADAKHIIKTEKDSELIDMAKEELDEKSALIEKLENELKILLLPKDPLDEKDVIVEIRGGAGGDEAALFAAALMRMYRMYAEKHRMKTEIIDINETEIGGVKEVVFSISGTNVYSFLKHESGVHRVQRVPDTESQGRVHTSTATVAVLPEHDEEINIVIRDEELKIDTYRSGGAGGQHVNTTDSAIRITHLPSGIVVQCQDERSQVKNRDKAMKVLKIKLQDAARQKAHDEVAANRKSQVGTGDRSERIRTYNFPQGRVTDHRIGMTLYSIDTFMDGDLNEMIEGLKKAEIDMLLGEIKK